MTAPAFPTDKHARAGIAICLLLMVLAPDHAAYAQPPGLNIRGDAGIMFDNNVTRAKDSSDKLSDQSYSFNLSRPFIFPLAEHTRARLTGIVGDESFIYYYRLSRAYIGGQGEYQYRSSAEFSAPTLTLFARIFGEQYQSSLRDGWHYSAGVSMQQPVTDRIQIGRASCRERV